MGATVAGTIFLFACGSASVPSVRDFGQTARWAGLLVLCGVALVLAARSSRSSLLVLSTPWAAAGLAFLALAASSAAWSVAPRLTLERSASFALLLATCAGFAAASLTHRRLGIAVLWGVLGGALLVTLAGVVVAITDYDLAVQDAWVDSPARFKGFGENPNTVPMLAAVALPIGVWALEWPSTRLRRGLVGTALLVLAAEVVASGSRGALVAGSLGCLMFVLVDSAPARRRLGAAATVVGAVVLALAISSNLPHAAPLVQARQDAPVGEPGSAVPPEPEVPPESDRSNAVAPEPDGPSTATRLEDELARPASGETPLRSWLGGSGRVDAWAGAVDQIARRPLLGYGFGTEERVFVDRFHSFQGGLPENSLLGLLLQLGAVGAASLVLLLVLLVAGVAAAIRSARGHRRLAVASAGVIGAGLVLAVVQSYVYSAGNIATMSVWLCASIGAAANVRPRDEI